MKKSELLNVTGVDGSFVNRSWEEDRRQVYDFEYWDNGGVERRSGKDRRKQKIRRHSWANALERSGVYTGDEDDR